MAELIPEESGDGFLSIDQLFGYIGSLASLVASAVVMTGHVDPWEYSFVFLHCGAGGHGEPELYQENPRDHADRRRRNGVHIRCRGGRC